MEPYTEHAKEPRIEPCKPCIALGKYRESTPTEPSMEPCTDHFIKPVLKTLYTNIKIFVKLNKTIVNPS